MYIQVSSAGVRLVDQDNFRAFAVEVVGDGVDLAGALEGIGETDGEHVYLDVLPSSNSNSPANFMSMYA